MCFDIMRLWLQCISRCLFCIRRFNLTRAGYHENFFDHQVNIFIQIQMLLLELLLKLLLELLGVLLLLLLLFLLYVSIM